MNIVPIIKKTVIERTPAIVEKMCYVRVSRIAQRLHVLLSDAFFNVVFILLQDTIMILLLP